MIEGDPLQRNTRIASFAPHLNNSNGSVATTVRRSASCLCSWYGKIYITPRDVHVPLTSGHTRRMSAADCFLYPSLSQYR